MMAGLDITGLSKAFGAASVLQDVSFSVPAGGMIAILGTSGSGKTTLLRLIAGFEAPDAGAIMLHGATLVSGAKNIPPERRAIGYVAQEGALFPHLNVADNITFGLPRAARSTRHRVAELLRMVDLPAGYADRAPQHLSGGEQQRVALARALAPSPRLILLDEPFSALDAGLRAETRQAVAAAIRQAGATAILVTHDQEEALSMGEAVGVLQAGRLVQITTPERLYRKPASPALANFVGEAVLLAGFRAGGTVRCGLGALAYDDHGHDGPVEIMIRPEQIKIAATPAPDKVAATVTSVSFYGHDAIIDLSLITEGPRERIKARVFSHGLPPIGAHVWLHVEGPVSIYAKAKPEPESKEC